jgi:hypothetical protein
MGSGAHSCGDALWLGDSVCEGARREATGSDAGGSGVERGFDVCDSGFGSSLTEPVSDASSGLGTHTSMANT